MRLKKESGEGETSDDAHMDIKIPKCTVFEKKISVIKNSIRKRREIQPFPCFAMILTYGYLTSKAPKMHSV